MFDWLASYKSRRICANDLRKQRRKQRGQAQAYLRNRKRLHVRKIASQRSQAQIAAGTWQLKRPHNNLSLTPLRFAGGRESKTLDSNFHGDAETEYAAQNLSLAPLRLPLRLAILVFVAAIVASFAVANTQAQVLGITAARAGDYVRALAECEALKDIPTADQLFAIGYSGLKALPVGKDRDRYIDCFESVALERTGSILLVFKINADTSRFIRADSLLESARQQGKPISGPHFVDFVATRADKPPAERLKEIESLANSGEKWAQEVMADLHIRRACAAYNGLCELVAEDRRAAIGYLEQATQQDIGRGYAARRFVDLTDLYLDQAAPRYEINSEACAKAREYARKGAVLDNACSMERLRNMYRNGRCQIRDDEAARSWSDAMRKSSTLCPIW